MGSLESTFRLSAQRCKRLLLPFLAALVVVGALVAPANAQDVLPADGEAQDARQMILQASQDAYVASLTPDANFGSAASVAVLRGGNAGPAPIFANALLQFPIPDFPAFTVIDAAILRLFQGSGGDGSTWPLPLGRITQPWREPAVTFNNRPAAITVPIVLDALASEEGAVTADLATLVADWISTPADDNYGFYITGSGELPRQRIFASREAAVAANRPTLQITYTLPPVRVCQIQNDTCPVAPNALVHNLTTGVVYETDASGYVSAADVGTIGLGDRLWARMPVTSANGGTQYYVQGAPIAAVGNQYQFIGNGQELRLVVEPDQSLWVQDLDVSAQWHVAGDPAFAAALARKIVQASTYLYSFTDGQFALGQVRIQQNYGGWDAAGMQLHANNTLRPRAFIGGVVAAETPDFQPTVPISYTTGPISMGSYWNRFGTPPNALNTVGGSPVTEAQMANDWSLAFAHELGHWLLYLFDTYTGVDGNASVELADLCTGTAMGNVYEPTNHGYIFSPDDWVTKCGETEAYARLNGRTEWATIAGWYPWVQTPTAFVPGPTELPSGITTVFYLPPATPPGAAAAQLFNLIYQNGEKSSGEARAFLMRNDIIIEQGKPAKESTQVQLTGAEVGDRLCVYDINDYSDEGETPRHQFGCEVIAAGDSTLVMTRNQTWSPQVALQQTGANQIQVIVTATVSGAAANQVRVRLYPEHESGLDEVLLPHTAHVYSTTLTIGDAVPPLFAQVYVGESPTAPTTRREVVVDRGTGGGGAFGPARLYGDVLVMSSDGNASFEGEGTLELKEGESIAWQSMPGTPGVPASLQILGQSYRLDAYPPSLVLSGTVRIRYVEPLAALGASATPDALDGGGAQVWFWNGIGWSPLATETVTPVNASDGVRLASAPSAGVGVYAVMMPSQYDKQRYLPMIAAE